MVEKDILQNYILSRLKLLGKTPTEVARRYGCSQSQVYKVANGHPSNGLRAHIARECGHTNWNNLRKAARSAYRKLERNKLIRK